MLAKRHRLTSGRDFTAVMRRGARAGTSTVVVAALIRNSDSAGGFSNQPAVPWRCGFVVSKAVGNAVTRHRTARRLRHIVRDLIESGDITVPPYAQTEIVVRALAASAAAGHPRLSADLKSGLHRSLAKMHKGQKMSP